MLLSSINSLYIDIVVFYYDEDGFAIADDDVAADFYLSFPYCYIFHFISSLKYDYSFQINLQNKFGKLLTTLMSWFNSLQFADMNSSSSFISNFELFVKCGIIVLLKVSSNSQIDECSSNNFFKMLPDYFKIDLKYVNINSFNFEIVDSTLNRLVNYSQIDFCLCYRRGFVDYVV